MSPKPDHQQRKTQLIAQADLERLRLRHASGQITHLLAPPPPAQPTAKWVAPVAGAALALLLPALGRTQAHKLVRTLSWAVTAYRAYRHWKTVQPPKP